MAKNETAPGAPPREYPDLHDHIRALDEAGLLLRVDVPINKDTEMHPLMRWQFRGGLEESERKAMLFTNIVDSKGKQYDIPVIVGGMAASPAVYQIGLGRPLSEATQAWAQAMNHPIPPRIVDNAPCQEVVIEGAELDKPGQGLDGLPIPISTPGWDNAPYLSTSAYITKDPDTGVQNMGVYRGHIKAPRRVGFNTSIELRSGGYVHWEKWKARGERMPAAAIVGAPPAIMFSSVQKAPENLDELSVAGGLAGHPMNVVRARTVDLLVPAEAEVVIEGYVDTEYLEPEGPFGESHGHVNMQEYNGFMEVTAITRRRDAVVTSFISQMAPSEASVLRRPGQEYVFLRHLRDHLGIKGVTRVYMHEPVTGGIRTFIVQFERGVPTTEVWRALYGMASAQRAAAKIVFATNEDIDPTNANMLLWAMGFRCKPHLDIQILRHKDEGHGPRDKTRDGEDSSLLIDATLHQDYPPVSLPKRQYMERAREIWEDVLGQKKLKPDTPWYGYSLGAWTDELEREAELAVQSRYWETGQKLAQRRRGDVKMNTEIRDVDDDPT